MTLEICSLKLLKNRIMLLSTAKNLAAIFSLVLFTSFSQNSCDLTVKITELQNGDGHLMISYWDKPDGFPDDSFTKELIFKDLNSPSHTFKISGLPYGEYALAALHDENTDAEMNYNWVGIPKEGFAFSRNYNVTIRAPRWEESVIQLNSPEKTIEMKMQY